MKYFLFPVSMVQVTLASHTPHTHHINSPHTQKSMVPKHLLWPDSETGPRNTTVRLLATWEPDYTERVVVQ